MDWGRYPLEEIVHYAPRTQSVSFSASASFGTERSEAAKTRTWGNVTLCVRDSIYYFFVRRPQNEFSRPVWKSWNSKFIILFYIVYFAASLRAAKIHFAAWGQKNKVNVNSFNILRERLARAHLLFLFFLLTFRLPASLYIGSTSDMNFVYS